MSEQYTNELREIHLHVERLESRMKIDRLESDLRIQKLESELRVERLEKELDATRARIPTERKDAAKAPSTSKMEPIDLTREDDIPEPPPRSQFEAIPSASQVDQNQPANSSVFFGHSPINQKRPLPSSSRSATDREQRAKRRRGEEPTNESASINTVSDPNLPSVSNLRQLKTEDRIKGELIHVGSQGEDHLVDGSSELDKECKQYIKGLTNAQRRANVKHNSAGLTKCIRVQFRLKQIKSWSNKQTKCDYCQSHGTQCVIFLDEQHIFLMS